MNPRLRLEGYHIYRSLSRQLPSGDEGSLHLFGARVAGKISDTWSYALQAAPQFGEKNGNEVRAFGFDGRLKWELGGSWRHSAHLGYEYLSGDDPETDEDEGWDPVWARRARWSELLLLTFGAEAQSRRGYWTNLQRPYAGWRASPTERLDLQAAYIPLLALENTNAGSGMFSEDGSFRGQLVQAVARLSLNRHLSGHLWAELFFPGDYYARDHRDMATFLRAELMLAL